MNKPTEKGLVPDLRFPEFKNDAEWEKKVLNNKDIATFVKDREPLDQLNLNSYVSTENLLADYSGVAKASKLPPSGSFTSYKPNDVLISNIRPYLKKVWFADKVGAASNDVIVIRPSAKISATYLLHVLKNDEFINFVMKGAKGVKMPRGDIASIQAYPIALPKSNEQQKIADCLSSLDELVSAHNQKLDALKAHKKGLMQQLFPAEGETVPKLRFPEFREDGDWCFDELGSKTKKVGSGITPKGGDKNYKSAGVPFVRSQNIGWGCLLLDNIAYIEEEVHQSFLGTEIKENDVLLNITGASIGRSAIADQRVTGGNVNQHVCIIRTKLKELHPVYLSQFILSPNGQLQIDSFQAGGNREGLNFAQIRSFSIPIPPNVEEQKKIADGLSSIDELITAQSKKIDALKAHKKGLMQQLFPTVNEVSA